MYYLLVVCCLAINKRATFENHFRFFPKNHAKIHPPFTEKQNFKLEQPNLIGLDTFIPQYRMHIGLYKQGAFQVCKMEKDKNMKAAKQKSPIFNAVKWKAYSLLLPV